MMTEMVPGTVTLADLFRVMSAMQADLAKVATRLEVIDSRNKNADDIHRDHEVRLRAIEGQIPPALDKRLSVLEQVRAKQAGAMALLGALSGGGTATLITWLLSRH
jgi:hypothetical protein